MELNPLEIGIVIVPRLELYVHPFGNLQLNDVIPFFPILAYSVVFSEMSLQPQTGQKLYSGSYSVLQLLHFMKILSPTAIFFR